MVCLSQVVASSAFMLPSKGNVKSSALQMALEEAHQNYQEPSDYLPSPNTISTKGSSSRRAMLSKVAGSLVSTVAIAPIFDATPAGAEVGSLPELADTNAILQGLTVNVADQSQQDSMISFLQEAFDFKVLRQNQAGPITDTWLGYGPEQLSIPESFELPVSSFGEYGGHASIRVRYDSKSIDALYRKGADAPGDNIAFLQVGVPQYRISKMVSNGGNVIDAYGIVNVVSPCGLPMRGIVGIWPDPMMFVAINCKDVAESRRFYEQLGFFEQEYPYARPSKGMGQFEPLQPKGSVYLSTSPNAMGILLLQGPKRKKITPNPVLQSLNLVYRPSSGSSDEGTGDEISFSDPSGTGISFVSVDRFEKEEKRTRI